MRPQRQLAVVSGAVRSGVETVLRAAAIDVFDAIVAAEDVARGKPNPEGYLRALDLLHASPDTAAAVEDAEPGVKAAKSAGLYCVAVLGTVPPERLAFADEIAPRLDVELVERLLG